MFVDRVFYLPEVLYFLCLDFSAVNVY